jgi:putative ABC transport system substrate-binding protein
VFTAVTNPVESGVVPSWKGSGRNLAGNSNWIPPETLLHVFRLTVPDLKRIGIMRSTVSGEVSDAELRDMRDYLAREGAPQVTIVEELVGRAADIPEAADRLAAANVEAVWIPIDFLVYSNLDAILPAVEPHRIPLVSSSLKAARAGAVTGVVVDYELLGKRALVIARDILDGKADPATMPVETMNAYKVVVNLDAARRCHYEVPLSLLVRADMILDTTASDGETVPVGESGKQDSANQREQDNE